MSDSNMLDRALDTAVQAAREAGSVLHQGLGRARQVNHKGFRDLVTELDLASQKKVIEIITGAFPEHRIIAEEGSRELDLSGPVWIVDPLDGTTNFVHGLPIYGVSICLAIDGRPKAGVVFDPEREELFAACAGKGAFLNSNPIRVSDVEELSQALVVTGFAYDLEKSLDRDLAWFSRMLTHTQGVRRLGSAALDLAYVACGRMDSFWEHGLHAWDMAAGVLLVQEAGGEVTDLGGGTFDLLSGRVLAGGKGIQDQMVEVLKG